jgi:Tat protein translocase TatB subunit
MDIFGVGFPELVLIFIISMMVFGPRRLPEMAAKVGKVVGDLRNMSQGLMTEWQREIAVASRLDELKKTQQELNQIKQEVKATRKEIAAQTSTGVDALQQARREIEDSQKQMSSPVPPSDDPAVPAQSGDAPEPAPPVENLPDSSLTKAATE